MRRKVSVHELKRRLMRRMSALSSYEADLVAVTIREHAALLGFLGGRSIDNLCNDQNHGAAWDRALMERAIRRRATVKS